MNRQRQNYWIVLLLGLALIGAACSNKANKVDSSNGNNNNPAQAPASPVAPNNSLNVTIQNTINKAKNFYKCTSGPRLSTDHVYYASAVSQNMLSNTTTVTGPFTKGSISGTPRQVFIGKGPTNDLVFAVQIVDGQTVKGYNIHLSFCGKGEIITNTTIQSLHFDGMMALDQPVGCSHGMVDSFNQVYMVIGPYKGIPRYPEYHYRGSALEPPLVSDFTEIPCLK